MAGPTQGMMQRNWVIVVTLKSPWHNNGVNLFNIADVLTEVFWAC